MYTPTGYTVDEVRNLFLSKVETVVGEVVVSAPARQGFFFNFGGRYLSTIDDEIVSNVQISRECAKTSDLEIGNVSADVCRVTFNDVNGYLPLLKWNAATAYAMAVDTETEIDIPADATCYIDDNIYGTSDGLYFNGVLSTVITDKVHSLIQSSTNYYAYTTDNAYQIKPDGTISVISGEQFGSAFTKAKMQTPHSLIYDLNNNKFTVIDVDDYIVEDDEEVAATTKKAKQTLWAMINVGRFIFEKPEINDSLYSFEAYDCLSLLDVPAYNWWKSDTYAEIDEIFQLGGYVHISKLLSNFMEYMGFSYTVNSGTVNLDVWFAADPFGYLINKNVSMRRILHFFCEATGTNARAYRSSDGITLYPYNTSSVESIDQYHIESNGLAITGLSTTEISSISLKTYKSGTMYVGNNTKDTYVILGNPLLTGEKYTDPYEPLNALLEKIATYPAYSPVRASLTDMNPCLDCGDFVTATDSDGNSYTYPVMAMDFIMQNFCCGALMATGNTNRSDPTAEALSEYANEIDISEMDIKLALLDNEGNILLQGNNGTNSNIRFANFFVSKDNFKQDYNGEYGVTIGQNIENALMDTVPAGVGVMRQSLNSTWPRESNLLTGSGLQIQRASSATYNIYETDIDYSKLYIESLSIPDEELVRKSVKISTSGMELKEISDTTKIRTTGFTPSQTSQALVDTGVTTSVTKSTYTWGNMVEIFAEFTVSATTTDYIFTFDDDYKPRCPYVFPCEIMKYSSPISVVTEGACYISANYGIRVIKLLAGTYRIHSTYMRA